MARSSIFDIYTLYYILLLFFLSIVVIRMLRMRGSDGEINKSRGAVTESSLLYFCFPAYYFFSSLQSKSIKTACVSVTLMHTLVHMSIIPPHTIYNDEFSLQYFKFNNWFGFHFVLFSLAVLHFRNNNKNL